MGKFHQTIQHPGLGVMKTIRAQDPFVLRQLVHLQQQKWNEQYQRKLQVQQVNATKRQAEEMTREALERRAQADGILAHTLGVDDTIDWETLKDRSTFTESSPHKPYLRPCPPKPDRSQVSQSFGQKVSNWAWGRPKETDEERYQQVLREWETQNASVIAENERLMDDFYHRQQEYVYRKYAFHLKIQEQNNQVEAERNRWLSRDPVAIEEYCQMVLSNSEYPDWITQDFELEFNGANGMLVVDFGLPAAEDIPRVKEFKYAKANDSIREVAFSERDLDALYESVCYQIAIRTIHEVIEADKVQALKAVVFNGIVNAVNPATGNQESIPVLSIQADRDLFERFDLSKVEPKACAQGLRCVAGKKLKAYQAISPIARLSHDHSGSIDQGIDLDNIPWRSFEHLVGQLFRLEFATTGGVVNVTQASRDGGVDAVILDPDPIRGGKFVVQAKKYSGTVPPTCVRDLYGTMLSEGAAKGILVTTSFFGPDSYGFAKDKPITLLDGNNLVYLLQKHGISATLTV